MKKSLLLIATSLLVSSPAMAQEYGLLVGVHQTDAEASGSGVSTDGKFNFKAGLAVAFGLMDQLKFRTGVIYNQRHFDVTQTTAGTKYDFEYKFAYLDVPALVQYNFNEMFGVFGGLVVAANVADDVDEPSNVTTPIDPDAETLLPLVSVGVNLMFEDMLGFDVYYERGLGDIAKNVENYSTYGANFVYWF